MKICAKCGRGIIGVKSRNAVKDAQAVWWTTDADGPMCNGRLVWVAREAQIQSVKDTHR